MRCLLCRRTPVRFSVTPSKRSNVCFDFALICAPLAFNTRKTMYLQRKGKVKDYIFDFHWYQLYELTELATFYSYTCTEMQTTSSPYQKQLHQPWGESFLSKLSCFDIVNGSNFQMFFVFVSRASRKKNNLPLLYETACAARGATEGRLRYQP